MKRTSNTKPDVKHKLDLLFLEKDGMAHYEDISNYDRLMRHQHTMKSGEVKGGHKKIFCRYCGKAFAGEDKFLQSDCSSGKCVSEEGVKYFMPVQGEKVEWKSKDKYKTVRCPFVVYLETEAFTRKLDRNRSCEPEGKTTFKAQYEMNSYCLQVIANPPIEDFKFNKPVLYRGENSVQHLFETLHEIDKEISRVSNRFKGIDAMTMSAEQRKEYNEATTCYFCGSDEPYSEENFKVRHHCHKTGAFLGASHTKCNFGDQTWRFKVPIFCHNMKGYDSHFSLNRLTNTRPRS
jgi:hypothetical protein